MAKEKYYKYAQAQSYVKNKDMAITTFINNTLDKLQEMFIYSGLPETIPQAELERILFTNGHAFITEINGKIYALSGTLGGEIDEYNRPTLYSVANVALNLSKSFHIGVDGVLMRNDYMLTGIMPIVYKYGALLVEAELSLYTSAILSRIQLLISAPDDKTKASADLFIDKIINGDFAVIAEMPFFDGVKMQNAPVGHSKYITQFIELVQYFKASFLHEIGLNSNFNMKREHLNDEEILLNVDALLPFADNMYHSRLNAVNEINKRYGLNIVVDYNSAWKTTHEERDKATENAETDTGEIITKEIDIQPEQEINEKGDENNEESQ